MNKINFTAKDNFPLSSDTMELLQQMINLSAAPALIGGSNYILSGCVDDGAGNISDGVIVINDELLSFQGGTKGSKITIQETTKTLTAFGEDYPEAYVYRIAKFSVSGEYDWADFTRITTNKELNTLFRSIRGDAPGTVKMWSGQTSKIPADYKLCNGEELLISDYPELFDTIGIEFGGNGTTNFKLPDLSGKFIVGFSNTESDYNKVGKNGGSKSVSLTTENLPAHKHIMPWGENVNQAWNPPWGYADGYMMNMRGSDGNDNDNAWAYSSPTGENKSFDARPPFVTLAYIIKVL